MQNEPSSPIQKRQTARLPALTQMKDGIGEQPFFLAPGGGSTVLQLLPLAKHIRSSRAVYGIQIMGWDGQDKIFDRVEDMAECYLEAIVALQPQGPYFLAGYSLGGLVMFEIAQRLSEMGEKTALLLMIDAFPHSRFMTPGPRLSVFTDWMKHHVSTMAQLPIGEMLPYLTQRIRTKMGSQKTAHVLTYSEPLVDPSLEPASQVCRQACKRAWGRYRPRFYKGRINFVSAQTGYPVSPTAVWSKLADKFGVETVPGGHVEVMTKNYEYVATIITQHLREPSN